MAVSDAVYQCVPNFSEGRRGEVVEAIADAMRAVSGVRLIDWSADADHNRCVMTLLGDANGVRQAVLAAARVAVTRIDLRDHSGVHPRAGAIDVVPVVPLRHATTRQAIALAADVGADLARELDLPVYFYEANARSQSKAALPDLRRGGFEAFAAAPLTETRAPDLGPTRVHASAGVVIVGARGPLVAYNVNLDTPDVRIAQHIARRIRRERDTLPELAGVRALGLYLPLRLQAQVSLNLTRPADTSLPRIFAFIREAAAARGVTTLESEIIGAIPRACLAGLPPGSIHWHTYKPTQILEHWLEEN